MRKIQIFAITALLALGFASCSKGGEEGAGAPGTPGAPTRLAIKLSGASDGTKAIQGQGSTVAGTIKLINGHIFVLNASDVVIYKEGLQVSDAMSANGQILDVEVPNNSRVYIVGNIASAIVGQQSVTEATDWTQIQGAQSAITTQGDYTQVTLANNDGSPKLITDNGDGSAEVRITLNPLVSRMELLGVNAIDNPDNGTQVTAFDVTGVFVDDYFPNFNYIGGGAGTTYNQGTDAMNFSGMGDTGSWSAVAGVAKPNQSTADVWAYQVAAGGTPRLIIRLENVYVDGTLMEDTDGNPEVKFLTVAGYNNMSTTTFQRGVIYRIPTISFYADKEKSDGGLDDKPNIDDVELKLYVDIEEWKVDDVTAYL